MAITDEGNNQTAEKQKSIEMQILSLSQCANIFADSVAALKKELEGKSFLVWDKDDKLGMDFVAVCANIRSHIFSIQRKSKFAAKCK